MNQKQKVKSFFDSISAEYQNKYTHSFLYYFFQERLYEATNGFSFKGKSILDIGAGTAAIYHFLKKEFPNLNYFATDISSKMLERSDLDSSKFFVGEISDFPFPDLKFDFIFVLGVTTYFNQNELRTHLNFIKSHLSSDGIAIISFTNKSSVDFKIRQTVRSFSRLLNMKKNVLGQSFNIFAYSQSEIKNITSSHFSIRKIIYLNQTLPPFNRLFPKTSIKLGFFLKTHLSSFISLEYFSSDTLFFLEKKKD